MNWIKVSDRLPDLNTNVLVIAKIGYCWDIEDKDDRPKGLFIGYFYDTNLMFKNLKPKIEFEVDCCCSGMEHDREEFDPTHWMPLPDEPKED